VFVTIEIDYMNEQFDTKWAISNTKLKLLNGQSQILN